MVKGARQAQTLIFTYDITPFDISIETFTKQCACTYDFIVELVKQWLLMK
jgi:hypothetical protein